MWLFSGFAIRTLNSLSQTNKIEKYENFSMRFWCLSVNRHQTMLWCHRLNCSLYSCHWLKKLVHMSLVMLHHCMVSFWETDLTSWEEIYDLWWSIYFCKFTCHKWVKLGNIWNISRHLEHPLSSCTVNRQWWWKKILKKIM